MAYVTESPESIKQQPRAGVLSRGIWSSPVVYWAAFGGASFLLLSYVLLSWIFSPDFRPVPVGPDQLTESENFWRITMQIVFPLMALACAGWVLRGCLQTRSFTFDAKLWIALVLQIWLDPVPNFLRPQVFFNGYYVNRGSWVEHIPGWISPNGANLPNALLLEVPLFGMLIAGVWIACWLMAKTKAKWPEVNTLGLLLVSLASLFVFTFVLEWVLCIKTGWLSWNGAIPSVTLWAGTKEQMPLTECLIVGAWLTMNAALRYYKDDKGVSFVEKGLDRIHVKKGIKQTLSLFAIIGFGQLSFMLYNVFTIPLALYIGPTPQGYPSYMTNQMCGQGTPYQCPGPGVPIIVPRPPNTTTK